MGNNNILDSSGRPANNNSSAEAAELPITSTGSTDNLLPPDIDNIRGAEAIDLPVTTTRSMDKLLQSADNNNEGAEAVDLPVATTRPTGDPLQQSNNNGNDNVVNNNNDNFKPAADSPTKLAVEKLVGNGSQLMSEETTSKRERRRPKYLADFVCDTIDTEETLDMNGAQASGKIASGQLGFAKPAAQDRMQLNQELSTLTIATEQLDEATLELYCLQGAP